MSCKRSYLFFSGFVEDVGEMASAAVLTVEMSRHEDAGATILVRTLTSQASDLAVLIDLRNRMIFGIRSVEENEKRKGLREKK